MEFVVCKRGPILVPEINLLPLCKVLQNYLLPQSLKKRELVTDITPHTHAYTFVQYIFHLDHVVASIS